ncbi:hypothetical protein RHMOL_Rhmol07G0225600 [Rhododendron molle]|uniref:Uncharacterized protein n=1 Tax=Rhododendron molle TaxID=49168 RepID=A0ACC0N3I5_RHOML|nr:hypothetical protein RHMOL_Rhmol07G0225600 [Rhododendron molle]
MLSLSLSLLRARNTQHEYQYSSRLLKWDGVSQSFNPYGFTPLRGVENYCRHGISQIWISYMECNKDEAIRAKGIVEKKMQMNDFEGARKIANKAQQLYPDLENIYQLIMVCNVHCSALNKICGSEMDWYGILQVERFANEVTIKKQYRKLALLLHPDKNKFPGAESAFKLIGEANMVLSDKGKRSLYDSKCIVSMRTAATKPTLHQLNRNFYDWRQYPPTEKNSSIGQQTFWTSCPFCNMRYQYYREHINRALLCQKCTKPFTAYDLGAQSVPLRSNFAQPPFPQQKLAQHQGSFNMGSDKNTGGFPPSHKGSQGNFSNKTMASKPMSKTGSTTEVGGGSTTKVKEDGLANNEGRKEGVGSAKVDAVKPRESRPSTNTNRKRRRKLVVESSESNDTATSADTEEVVIQENGGSPAGPNSEVNGVNHPRRSFRKRQHVSYNESLGDMSPLRWNASSRDSKEELKASFKNGVSRMGKPSEIAAVNRDNEGTKEGHVDAEGSLPNRSGEVNGEATVMGDHNAGTSGVKGNDSESDSDSSCDPEPVVYECPDTEFNDFEKDREENCFGVDQLWACYDTTEGMPRFYARIRKVFSPGFRLRITWLEPHLEDPDKINWFNGDLPIGCGKFIQGETQEAIDRVSFSHQVQFQKGSERCSYLIYPRKGETWALFKDWDISWSSDPENHKKYQYEIVEVISDFVSDDATRVAYLEKVVGFVSVFQPTSREGKSSVLIPPAELLRFSHRVPSFKLMGTEKEGIPEGSFELDPAALDTTFDEHGDAKMEAEGLDVKADVSNHKSPEKSLKTVKSAEKLKTPEKCVGSEGKTDFDKETFTLRRSPRELNHKDKKKNQTNYSPCPTQERTTKDLHGAKDKIHADLTPSKGSTLSSQGGEKTNLPMNCASPRISAKNSIFSKSFSPGGQILEESHGFKGEKSVEKFDTGQIWALYDDEGMPKISAQVKKVLSSPFRLRVVVLESCTLSKGRAHAVCCGTFKLQTGKDMEFSPDGFSHMLAAEPIGKNLFKIFPRVGEIWALYKDWNAEISCSDLKKGKYEIVQVLENNERCIKIATLARRKGFKSVFGAPRRLRSGAGEMEIPQFELARFSHQIPAFNVTEEKDRLLSNCWELDLAAIPGTLFLCPIPKKFLLCGLRFLCLIYWEKDPSVNNSFSLAFLVMDWGVPCNLTNINMVKQCSVHCN